jgi:hypothetical protein
MNGATMRIAPIFFAAAALAVFAAAARGQAFDLSWHSIDAGAQTSGADGFSLTGTLGQPDAGELTDTSGSGFSLSGGFEVAPPAGVCGSADFNCDGDLGTDADIAAFFACLSGNCPPTPCTASADFNGDGDIGTDADIAAFFLVLGGGSC